MNLIKDNWITKDGCEFTQYLETLKNDDKIVWTANLLKTSLPVLAIKTPVIKRIAKEIAKGNYLSFLDLMLWDYYDNTAINGFLISQIKDFAIQQKYLNVYSARVDNWASCDLLTFNTKSLYPDYLTLSKKYIKSKKPFVRRIGIDMLFKLVDNPVYLEKIFHILNSLSNEQDYYVNMVSAWLVCECFIKHRDTTLTYLNHHQLNNFTINKAISKCRDSYRISKEDKVMLLKYQK